MSNEKVEALLHPRNIVLVGASDRPHHWSGRVRANLARFGYEGGVYPVNPRRAETCSRVRRGPTPVTS